MLYQICKEKTALSPEDIRQLEAVAAQLPLIAELTGADVFIDCAALDGRAIVVAQARPSTVDSSYQKVVVGEYALPDKEPAVFHSLAMQVPVRELKAITQEERAVRQDAVPIFNPGGQCIAVLIQERDISSDLRREQKFQQLAQTYEEEDRSLRTVPAVPPDIDTMREVHHRVKTSLQLVANILSLQSRRCRDSFTQKILQENVGRVLSIASIHDILTQNETSIHRVDSRSLLEQLRRNLQAFVPDGKRISIRIEGDGVPLSADTASSVALVVNELITNALEHAFPERDSGHISVTFCAGSLFHTITVTDDGCGFDVSAPRTGSLGLNIVDAMVRDRLRGHLTVRSDHTGSRISFDLKTE